MSSLRKMWRFLKPYKIKLIFAITFIFIAAVLTAAAPAIEGFATTQLAKDVAAIHAGVAGAHIQYDIYLENYLYLTCNLYCQCGFSYVVSIPYHSVHSIIRV